MIAPLILTRTVQALIRRDRMDSSPANLASHQVVECRRREYRSAAITRWAVGWIDDVTANGTSFALGSLQFGHLGVQVVTWTFTARTSLRRMFSARAGHLTTLERHAGWRAPPFGCATSAPMDQRPTNPLGNVDGSRA